MTSRRSKCSPTETHARTHTLTHKHTTTIATTTSTSTNSNNNNNNNNTFTPLPDPTRNGKQPRVCVDQLLTIIFIRIILVFGFLERRSCEGYRI